MDSLDLPTLPKGCSPQPVAQFPAPHLSVVQIPREPAEAGQGGGVWSFTVTAKRDRACTQIASALLIHSTGTTASLSDRVSDGWWADSLKLSAALRPGHPGVRTEPKPGTRSMRTTQSPLRNNTSLDIFPRDEWPHPPSCPASKKGK